MEAVIDGNGNILQYGHGLAPLAGIAPQAIDDATLAAALGRLTLPTQIPVSLNDVAEAPNNGPLPSR